MSGQDAIDVVRGNSVERYRAAEIEKFSKPALRQTKTAQPAKRPGSANGRLALFCLHIRKHKRGIWRPKSNSPAEHQRLALRNTMFPLLK